MTNKKETAQKIMEAFYTDWTDDEHIDDKIAVINVLREVINQLQQSPGVISCADMLELCEEIEKL
jgi:hypothetical protein